MEGYRHVEFMDAVRVSLSTGIVQTLLLRDTEKRVFAIPISEQELIVLHNTLEGEVDSMTLPLLVCRVVESLGGMVEAIIISEGNGEEYSARMILREGVEGKRKEVDIRPSDAIAISQITGAPIYAANSILDNASIHSSEIENRDEK